MSRAEKTFEKTSLQEIPAIRFRAGGWEALILPGYGGNVVELKDLTHGLSILRQPTDIEYFKKRPQVYGIPVLFPPNRISNGTFTAGERTYHFPINEPERSNHIHGFLRFADFKVTRMEETRAGGAEIELLFEARKDGEIFRHFPHEFDFRLLYTLSSEGLEQRITIKNLSAEPMPLGLGFHTAFNVPFHPDSDPASYRLVVSIGKRWEMNESFLPTGELHSLAGREESYRTEGLPPAGEPISAHYTAEPLTFRDKPFNGAILTDRERQLSVVYEVDEAYRHWVVWNETGDKGFICPEPQTWAINAPNIRLSPDLTGYRELTPGGGWESVCSISVSESG